MHSRVVPTGRAVVAFAFIGLLLAAQPALADSLTLMWDPNTGSVSGYAVYMGTQPGSTTQRVDVGNTTTFTFGTAVAGQQYCFAVAAYVTSGEGPKSSTVCGVSNEFPTLTNPGNRTSTTGQAVTLQLAGTDPDGQPITYGATGLPPGLTLMSGTGFISGTPTAAGTYAVTASVSDGVLSSAPQSFTWSVSAVSADTTAPSIVISGPTSATSYVSTTSAVALSGTSADNIGVTSVTWASDRGGSGTATGTTNWNVPTLGLQSGANVITLTARDAAGNKGTDVLTITYTPADATLPTIGITGPTTSSSYTTTSATMALGGTAADNVGVTQVSWTSDRGVSGTASGTTSWSVSSVALQVGTNVITATARDAAGNRASDVITVTYAPADTSSPTVTILGPTSAASYTSTTSVVTVGGSAADDRGIAAITWANDRGGTGFASGTTSWSIASVTLQSGTNVVTVTAQDAAGNRGTDVLTITYSAPAPAPAPEPTTSIVLSGNWYVTKRSSRAVLQWSLVSGRYIDVYRNGARITRTSNDGSYVDSPKGSGPFNYRVCASRTSVCSNTVTMTK